MIIPLFFNGGSGTGSDEVTATSNQVLKGYTAVTNDSNDEPIEGTIESEEGRTVYVTSSDQTIVNSDRYLAGNIIINEVSQSNLSSANILRNKTITISNGLTNIWSITGNSSNIKCVTGSFTAYYNDQNIITITGYSGGISFQYAYSTINCGITALFCITKNYTSNTSTILTENAYVASNSDGMLLCGCRNGPNYVMSGLPLSASSNVKLYYNATKSGGYTSVSYYIFGY